jgi:iron only hydrogenase large subunit-like protein
MNIPSDIPRIGCINGGGQIRATPPENPKEFVRRVEQLYHLDLHRRAPDDNPAVREIYSGWLSDGPYSKRAKELFHTQYHAREKFQNKLAIKW